ncbi:MAG: peptidoglycan DD-metalloendopeptidase family protein [Candidatus Adlerbacteria bacterium]|nr:peptidoglycan DD-metalloendopeptidase family protein [Candidatus Adlerbacteria bacterium]
MFHNTDPAQTERAYSSGRAKKSLVLALVLGGASFVFSIPLLASASIFASLLQTTAAQTSAAGSTSNSQTMVLLAPAVNLDPHPAVGGGDISLVDGSALLAQEGPSGTAADIESKPTNPQVSVYTVHEGDTLSGIAKMFDVTAGTILGANDIKGGIVHPGQTLIILPIPGIQHTVLKGETLASLAKKYNSDAGDIAKYNALALGDSLVIGDTILIPGGEVSAPVQTPAKTPTKTKTPTNSHSKLIANIKNGSKTEPYLGGSGPSLGSYFTWPVAGGIITQGLHGWNGVDIGAAKGTAIYAAAGGTVIVAQAGGGWNGGYGSYVVVQHGNGTQTLYAHMSKVLVSAGDSVDQGDTLGKVGATGEATGPHLHFEVRGAENPFADMPLGSSN